MEQSYFQIQLDRAIKEAEKLLKQLNAGITIVALREMKSGRKCTSFREQILKAGWLWKIARKSYVKSSMKICRKQRKNDT